MLAKPEPAAALYFHCYYVIPPSPHLGCHTGTLPKNNASGWTAPRNFFAHRAVSNVNTMYLKGLAVHNGSQMLGWWYGGLGTMEFQRINNNASYFWGYQAICKNADTVRAQTMYCQTVRD